MRQLGYAELLDGIARTANALRSLLETQFVLWGAATAASALPINPLL